MCPIEYQLVWREPGKLLVALPLGQVTDRRKQPSGQYGHITATITSGVRATCRLAATLLACAFWLPVDGFFAHLALRRSYGYNSRDGFGQALRTTESLLHEGVPSQVEGPSG